MSIETLANVLAFMDIESQYFEINAGNDILVLTSSEGGPRSIDIPDGTYDGAALAAALQTAMLADNILTGTGTISFTVSYSTTTHKFTISTDVGATIAYTHSGSDAGFTFGFTADVAAAQSIISDTPTGDPTAIVQTLLTETESWISRYCRRVFESTAYSLERYNGRGYSTIMLKQYPVSVVDRVAIGSRNAITVKNTNTGSSAAVSVSSTGLRLILDGTAETDDLTFATNATISDMVAAINAIGNGWVASVENTDYSSFVSSDLITQSALGCINSSYVYLTIPGAQESDIEVDYDSGIIRFSPGFRKGFRNIFIDYTAGYSDTDMPDDLKVAVKIIVQYMYEKMKNDVFGIDFYNIGASGSTGLRTVFEKKNPMPKEALAILSLYKRRLV